MCPPELGAELHPPDDPPNPRDGGEVRTLIIPLACTSRETLPRLLTVPRGIPIPAVRTSAGSSVRMMRTRR